MLENVWGLMKYAELANFVPDDVMHLEAEVATSLHFMRSHQALLRGYFEHAGLSL